MLTYEFRNKSGRGLSFRIYEREEWLDGSTLILQVSDSTPVDAKFNLRRLMKECTNSDDLLRTAIEISNIIKGNFTNGSSGYKISYSIPNARPSIEVKMPTNYMEVGEEMLFEIEAKNLEGKIMAFIPETAIARVLPDGRTIKALSAGMCNLKVGTKEFNKEFPIKIEDHSTEVEKVEVEVDKDIDGKRFTKKKAKEEEKPEIKQVLG